MEITASRSLRLGLCLAVLALVPVVLWPGDVSWLTDESRIIASAWHANHDRQLAAGGLYGNFGIRYGPLPTQIYQALLLITHDPVTLVVIRGLLCAGATAAALLWLARTLALPAWFAAALLVSPYMVAYQRVLWDASFCMPLGALAFAAFADFLSTRRAWSLRLCVGASAALPLIHPQALACGAPLLGWLVWRHRPDLWRDRRGLAMLGVGFLALHGFYIVQATGQLFARLFSSMEHGYPGGGSRLKSALAPLLGGRLLCGADYLEKLARPAGLPTLQAVARWSSLLVYPLAWLGIGLSAYRARALFTAAGRGNLEALSVRDRVAMVALAGLVIQLFLAGVMRIPAQPQYFFGAFILHAFVAWLAVDFLRQWRGGAVPGVLYGVGSAVLTVSAALVIHAHGFEHKAIRWPTMANDVAMVRTLNRFSEPEVFSDIELYEKHPQILRTLRLLLPPMPGAAGRGRILLRYRTEEPATGQVESIELPADAAVPPDAVRLDVSPLPKDWVPDPSTW
jgi:hypothetical protein